MQDSNLIDFLSPVLSGGTDVRDSRDCWAFSHITYYSLLLPAADKNTHTSDYAEIASGYLLFVKNMVGCNQPKQDPVAEVWRQTLPGQIKTLQGGRIYMCFGENPIIVQIVFLLREKNEADLHLIHEIVRRL